MATLAARDVRTKILARINDAIYGINAFITTINTERSETTPTLVLIDPLQDQGQYPVLLLDLGASQYVGQLAKYDSLIEIFELKIIVLLKGNPYNVVKQWAENYIEAILRSLQGFNETLINGSYWITARESIREDIDTDAMSSTCAIGVIFDVHRNEY